MYEDYIDLLVNTIKQIDVLQIQNAEKTIIDCWMRAGKIYIIGNGGSAATASHWVCDFGKIVVDDRKRFAVCSLTDSNAWITAISNDINYESIFEEQLINVLNPNDLVIGISASGNSPNVIKAFQYVKKAGATSLCIVGFNGGKLKEISDHYIYIPAYNYGVVEDIQLSIDHMISQEIRRKLTDDLI